MGKDEGGPLRIVFVANGSPAEQSGIQIGDRLVAVDGTDPKQYGKQYASPNSLGVSDALKTGSQLIS